MMETIKVYGNKLTNEERETLLYHDPITKSWTMDCTEMKFVRKAVKQGWTPIKQYVYEDGMVCGMVLTAPERSVTIRSTEKKQVSDKQLEALLQDNE